MNDQILQTSRVYLGLTRPTSGQQRAASGIAHRIDTTLNTIPKNTFNEFLRELVDTTQIHFHSTKDKIDKSTKISTTNDNDEIFYSTVGELMAYLGDKISNHSMLIDFFEKNFVVMTFIEK